MASNFTDFFRPKVAQRNGLMTQITFVRPAATASSTVNFNLPVGRQKVSVLSAAIDGEVAAAGSGAITAQLFKVTAAGVATALTAATSLTNSVVTAVGNFNLAITSTLFDGGGNATRVIDGTAGEFLRVAIVAAGTVTTNFSGAISAELAVKE